MSNLTIFISANNERVFHKGERPLGGLQIKGEVIEWLKTAAAPYYVCRRDVMTSFREPQGQYFYFSKPSAVAMFKLAWWEPSDALA
jgi:hypothetical protein